MYPRAAEFAEALNEALGREPWDPREPAPRTGLIVDVETTGTDPAVDEILSVACAWLDGDRPPAVAASLVKPPRGTRISRESTEVHGLTAAKLRNAPSFGVAWTNVVMEIEASGSKPNPSSVPIIAHNAAFDAAFLRRHRREATEGTAGAPEWCRTISERCTAPATRWTDTLRLSRRDIGPMRSYSLDAVAAWHGHGRRGDTHDAGEDVRILALCLQNWGVKTAAESDLFSGLGPT